MSDIEKIKFALNEWLQGLDAGDLDRMVVTCHPEVIVCNEYQPTTIGIQAIRDKYGPRIEQSIFKSGFEIQHLKVYGDFAILIGYFTVEITHKETGQTGNGEGRLTLAYQRLSDGSWKMLLDVDNNDETNAPKA